MKSPSYACYTMWALDFLRAFHERPKIFQAIAKLFMGRYARKELKGLVWALEKEGWCDPYMDYGLEDLEYEFMDR